MCKDTWTSEIMMTDCNAGAERYTLEKEGEYCYFRQVTGHYVGYYISDYYTYLTVVNQRTQHDEGWKCDVNSILAGEKFFFSWGDGGNAYNVETKVETECDVYQRIKHYKNQAAISIKATFIESA
jgi:hypothetical protein